MYIFPLYERYLFSCTVLAIAIVLGTATLLAHLALVIPNSVSLAHMIRRLGGKLFCRHANHQALRGGIHHSAESPEVLGQKHPATPAWPADPQGVECESYVDQVVPVLVLLPPVLPSSPHPGLQHIKQRAQRIDFGVNTRCGPTAQAVEPPSDYLSATDDERQMVVPGAAPADLILWGIVDRLFHPAPPPPVGELLPGPRRRAWGYR